MEPNVVISNQYNQFCVGGVPEHPVEAAHVIVPVLQRERQQHRPELKRDSVQAANNTKLPREAHER